MEQYRLIFRGERCGHYAKLPLDKHLDLLKFSERARTKILQGNKVALKSGLTHEQAQQQQVSLEKIGLVTERRLQLNAEIFAAGLREVKSVNKELDTSLPTYELGSELAEPVTFQRPDRSHIKCEDAAYNYTARSHCYQFNRFALIVMSAYMGLIMQKYVIILVKYSGFANALATVSGVLFILACVLSLPRLFQPLLQLSIEIKNKQIQLFEKPELILGKKRFLWDTEEEIGEFTLTAHSAAATSVEILYQWNAHHSIEDSSEQAVHDIQDYIIDGTAIEVAQTLYERIKPIVMFLLPRKKGKNKINWQQESASLISTPDGEAVALIYQTPKAAYKIIRQDHTDNIILHAFCLSIHQRGLL